MTPQTCTEPVLHCRDSYNYITAAIHANKLLNLVLLYYIVLYCTFSNQHMHVRLNLLHVCRRTGVWAVVTRKPKILIFLNVLQMFWRKLKTQSNSKII